jgi:hypothetical protein
MSVYGEGMEKEWERVCKKETVYHSFQVNLVFGYSDGIVWH